MILTLTGASGSGKTTIAEELLKEFPIESQLVPSYTTRKPRDTDLPGEYVYIGKFKFWLMDLLGIFIWTVYPHGNNYGTTKLWVKRALRNDNLVYIMILTPDAVKKLNSFAEKLGYFEQVFCFYILSPPREVLRERLKKRGDSEEEVEKRLANCSKWDWEAFGSGIRYEYLRNDKEVEVTVEKLKKGFFKKFSNNGNLF